MVSLCRPTVLVFLPAVVLSEAVVAPPDLPESARSQPHARVSVIPFYDSI